jgi:hypothetical protein
MKLRVPEVMSLILVAPAAIETEHKLSRNSLLAAEGLVIAYIAAVAAAAGISGIPYLLFPELGALVYDVLTRPWGKWARQPIRLIITPALTACVGTLVTRHMPFTGLSVLIIVVSSIAIIMALRSAIAPAMSAGVLPLVLAVKSWLYPPSIVATLGVLVAVSLVWRRYHGAEASRIETGDVEDALESVPRGRGWAFVLLIFVLGMAEAARLSGLRFLLFPPLVTIAYEMFGHPETCPWTRRPITLPIMCFLTATCGLLAHRILGPGIGMAVVAVVIGIALLRAFYLHMPPAMAIGLLPAVMTSPDYKFPFAVLGSTLCLTAVFLIYRKMESA